MVYFEAKSTKDVVVTVKGQMVIPPKLRRKFGKKKITRLPPYEKNGVHVIKPISDEYIRGMAGMAGTKGRLLKALKKEKAREARR